MLSKYDSIEAAPEQREGPEAIDITVRHDNTRNTEVVIEAKNWNVCGKEERSRQTSSPAFGESANCDGICGVLSQ